MKFYDNLMIPVITATRDGMITYKNRAAKRCIPSPRMKANIFHHINKDNDKVRRDLGNVRVEHIKNDRSIFNRALVVCDTEIGDEIWFFSPELQLFEPEDINDHHITAMAEWLRENVAIIIGNDNTPTESRFKRYQRAGEELLYAMKYLDIERISKYIRLADIISSLKEKTEELAGNLNLRISFSVGILFDPHGACTVRFRPFASVYAQLLNLIVRISKQPVCSVEAIQIQDKLDMIFTSNIPTSPFMTAEGSDLCALQKAFPNEAVNILFLEQNFKFMNYKLYYTLTADGLLTLHLYVPINDKRGYPVREKKPAMVVQRIFQRAEKRVHEYLEAMLTYIAK